MFGLYTASEYGIPSPQDDDVLHRTVSGSVVTREVSQGRWIPARVHGSQLRLIQEKRKECGEASRSDWRGDKIEILLEADKFRVSGTAQRTDARKLRQRWLSREGDQTSVERTFAKRSPNDDIRRRPCPVELSSKTLRSQKQRERQGSSMP